MFCVFCTRAVSHVCKINISLCKLLKYIKRNHMGIGRSPPPPPPKVPKTASKPPVKCYNCIIIHMYRRLDFSWGSCGLASNNLVSMILISDNLVSDKSDDLENLLSFSLYYIDTYNLMYECNLFWNHLQLISRFISSTCSFLHLSKSVEEINFLL